MRFLTVGVLVVVAVVLLLVEAVVVVLLVVGVAESLDALVLGHLEYNTIFLLQAWTLILDSFYYENKPL